MEARELAELLVRGVQLDEGALEMLLRALRIVVEQAQTEMHGETLTRCCWAPSWRLRSRRFRSVSLAEMMRARERRISSSTRFPRGDVEAAEEVSEAILRVVHDRRGPVDDEPFAVRGDMLVLEDARRVVRPQPREVLLRPRHVLGGDEELPERLAEPALLREAAGLLQRLVDAEQRALFVHEREEARRRAHDRVAEVPLALELARLASLCGEVADDEDELVGPHATSRPS